MQMQDILCLPKSFAFIKIEYCSEYVCPAFISPSRETSLGAISDIGAITVKRNASPHGEDVGADIEYCHEYR